MRNRQLFVNLIHSLLCPFNHAYLQINVIVYRVILELFEIDLIM